MIQILTHLDRQEMEATKAAYLAKTGKSLEHDIKVSGRWLSQFCVLGVLGLRGAPLRAPQPSPLLGYGFSFFLIPNGV